MSSILCNLKVHMSPPLVSVLSQTNPVQILLSYFFNIHFDIFSYLPLGLTSNLFTLEFRAKKICIFLLLSMHDTCPCLLLD
jgi:uncharacterized membrane-anchored protein YitT (DUF2179 family)